MLVAALFDIHGNLPALDAVLAEVRAATVDLIIVGGDVLPGPMPREALSRLLELDIPVQCIQGNGDRVVLTRMRGSESEEVPLQFRETIRWNALQLDGEHERVLASWPKTFRVTLPDLGDVLFCHATPRNDSEIFTRLTADERLKPAFEGVDAALVVCGHTHMQFDRRVGKLRLMNAGSVGMPFGAPGAYWLLLGATATLMRTQYDLARAAARIRATSYPQAADFAERNVLHPPAETEMLTAFSRAELK